MKRIAELFMTVCFLGILAAGLVVTLAQEREAVSFWENRSLAEFPEYSAKSVGNGSYTTQIEEYLSDHAALRTTLLMAKARLDVALRRPVVNDVVVTEHSLLPYLPYETVDPAKIDTWAAAMADRLERINDTVTGYGGYFCYTAVPCQAVSLAVLLYGRDPPSSYSGRRLSLVSEQWGAAQSGKGRRTFQSHGGTGHPLPECGDRAGEDRWLIPVRLPGG